VFLGQAKLVSSKPAAHLLPLFSPWGPFSPHHCVVFFLSVLHPAPSSTPISDCANCAELETGAGRRADQALYPMQWGSFVGRGRWLHATSPCWNHKAEKEATVEVLLLLRSSTHTCSELPSRIVLWNASYMQKHFHYTWQEWVSEETRKAQEATITIASAVPKIEVESRKFSDCENHTGTQNCRRGVLGLAPCHDDRSQMDKPLQVRQRDVSLWYHCDFWPSSLAQEPGWHLCPLLKSESWKRSNSRGFTSVKKFHTHTLAQHSHAQH
jgi:hypothetical protein